MPYIRTKREEKVSSYGFGLGTFIGKTLLEKNFAVLNFENSKEKNGAIVKILWNNQNLKKIN